MRIKKLEIRGFGRFEKKSFSLDPGLNIIYGLNESGKTTLQSFIKGMLFGLRGGRRTKDGNLPPMRQYKPWVGKMYGGMMEYALDNGKRIIVGRDFEKNTVNIQDEYSNNITAEFPAGKEEGARFAEQHLGLPENSFVRTAWIGQMHSAVDNQGRKILAERLMNLKQSGDEEVSLTKAIKALKEAQLSYVGSERTTTRPLNLLDISLADARDKEQVNIRLHESQLDTFLEIDKCQKEAAILKTELEKLETMRKALAENLEISKLEFQNEKLCQYRELLSDLEREKQEKETHAALLKIKLESLKGYQRFSRNDANKMAECDARYRFLKSELDTLNAKKAENEEKRVLAQNMISQYSLFDTEHDKMEAVFNEMLQHNSYPTAVGSEKDKQERTTRRTNRKLISLVSFLVVLWALMDLFLFRHFLPSMADIIILVTGSAVLAVSLVGMFKKGEAFNRMEKDNDPYGKAASSKNQKLLNQWMVQAGVDHLQDLFRLKTLFENKKQFLQDLRQDRLKLEQKEEPIRTKLNLLETEIKSCLRANPGLLSDSINEEDIRVWKENFESCHLLMTDLKETENALLSLQQRAEGVFRELSMFLGMDIETLDLLEEVIQRNKSLLDTKELTLVGYRTLEEVDIQIQKTREKIRQNELNIVALKTRLENIPDGEMLQSAHEKVQSLLIEKERIVFLGRALDTAMQVLTEASVTVQRDYVPQLSREMGAILSTITDGKYEDILTDDQLLLNIQPSEMTERVNPEQLSSGTSDQVYLALRLAAVRMVEREGERLPLFFDEPFAQYDEIRTQNALRLLIEESRKRQIILFTCKKREIELIQEICGDELLHMIELES